MFISAGFLLMFKMFCHRTNNLFYENDCSVQFRSLWKKRHSTPHEEIISTDHPEGHGFCPCRFQSMKPVGEERGKQDNKFSSGWNVSSWKKKVHDSFFVELRADKGVKINTRKEGLRPDAEHNTNTLPWCGIQGFHPLQRCDWKCPQRCEEWSIIPN